LGLAFGVLSRRWRNLRASFIAFVPFAVLVAALVIVLVRTYSLGRYTVNSVKERGSHGALRLIRRLSTVFSIPPACPFSLPARGGRIISDLAGAPG
jgi:hypothetical protein